MYAGLDFGTSNSALGIWEDNQPKLLTLDNGSRFISSTVYIGKSQQFMQLRPQDQTLAHAMSGDGEKIFGNDAITKFLESPEDGFFVKSPKSFLGARLKPQQLLTYEKIVRLMMSNIKRLGEAQTAQPIESIVIGKPVKFHGTQGEQGNQQAVQVLTSAATDAGFKRIEFQFEPIAAALDYERSLNENLTALIVDIGGGTTDCSMIKVGPAYRELSDRNESILGYSGDRIGGLDLDIKLAFRQLAPLFGKDELLKTGLPTPANIFWNAVCINNVDAQTTFYSAVNGREIHKLLRDARPDTVLDRLLHIYESMLSYHISQSAEGAKIALSSTEVTSVDMAYLEAGLRTDINREQLQTAISNELNKFISLMKEVEQQAQVAPDVIYVTGGTARSPIVDAYIRAAYPAARIVFGDLFGSVASGLTTWAHRIFS